MKIGGEFQINPTTVNNYCQKKYKYKDEGSIILSSGRNALLAILNYLSEKKRITIHVPYYICPAVLDICAYSKIIIKFYEPNLFYDFPIEYINRIKKGETLLTVNYFGFIDDNITIKKIKTLRPDIITISDQVQSFWTFKKSIADFSFTSLRKHFPTTQGALIRSNKTNFTLKKPGEESTVYKFKLIASLLKYINVDDKIYLDLFNEGEKILENEKILKNTNNIVRYLYNNIDFKIITTRRKNNCEIIYREGEKLGLNFVFPYNKNVIPMNIPIILKNRDETRKNLIENKIYLPIHWLNNKFYKYSIITEKMMNKSLSLVCDQRYSERHMKYQMNKLKEYIEK